MIDPQLSPLQRFSIVLSLALATLLLVLDYSIANVSLPYIAGSMAAGVEQGTYVITSFAVGNCIGIALTGWVSSALGQIRTMVIAIALFTLFSALCGASLTFEMLVVSRFFQGLVSGPISPLSQSLIVTYSAEGQKLRNLAIWSITVFCGPLLGPVIGGWITFNYSWPWIFFINIPIGALCVAVLYFWAHRRQREKISFIPSDWVGLILLSLSVTSLQIALDKGQQWNWLESPLITTLLITFVITLILFIIWELYEPSPLLNLRCFTVPSFTTATLFISCTYPIYFGTIILIPLWLQNSMGYTSLWAGLSLAPIGLASILFIRFISEWQKKVGPLFMLFICVAIFSSTCFFIASFTTYLDYSHIMFRPLLVGFALLFYALPMLSLCIKDIPDKHLPQATSIFQCSRALFGGIGTALFTTLWTRRSSFHHERIVETLSSGSDRYVTAMQTLPSEAPYPKSAMLNALVDQQATTLALNDCFYFMGWVFLSMFLLLLGLAWKEKRIWQASAGSSSLPSE